MKTTIIYHSGDYDGIFCREIARKFLPEAELSGWNFGDEPPAVPSGPVYILDLPVDRVFGLDFKTQVVPPWLVNVIWIDHHKSSIETHPNDIPGYRIDGVAACRLAWQWFSAIGTGCYGADMMPPELPTKQDYIDRKVKEPLAVCHAGEYDIWDHRGDGDLEFQFGLDAEEGFCGIAWNMLLSENTGYTNRLVEQGRGAMACYRKRDADVMRERSRLIKWEGLTFLSLNTAKCNFTTFAALDVPETGHDALLAFYMNRQGTWTISLYHAKHRTDLDLSQIAVKYGGGGHRGACGFMCEKLPFL